MLQVTTKALFCPLNFRFYYYNNNICFLKYFLFRNILKKYFFIFKNLFFYISILKKSQKHKKLKKLFLLLCFENFDLYFKTTNPKYIILLVVENRQ
jgi:hypothetical protein